MSVSLPPRQLALALAVLLPAAVWTSPLPTDCSDVYKAGMGQSGVYAIYPAGPTSVVQVYCDMSMDNSPEKWTVSRWTVARLASG